MSASLDAIIIGAGQAGLAMGYFLARQGYQFLILDGAPAIGHSWRTRYDSLRLFTPAEYNHLPGLPFPAPAGTYPTRDQVTTYLMQYAKTFQLPVHLNEAVQAVRQAGAHFLVETEQQRYEAKQVVIATGPFQRPFVPTLARDLAPSVYQLHSAAYQNPTHLPPGEVLVVGAGNSGAQIAEELAPTRQVYLAAGHGLRTLPQRLLGKDTFWWLHRLGLMSLPITSPLGKHMSRLEPIFGTDIQRLVREHGLKLVGRAQGARGKWIDLEGGEALQVPTVIWATGFRPDFGWVDGPVLDE
ncbi:MAG: NAD(P)-binding domain-containing protein, partial [Ardenticatenales bacterium]|nr:NAD(P)-binding domain-containing protein [Ardenticatenales bacterium]